MSRPQTEPNGPAGDDQVRSADTPATEAGAADAPRRPLTPAAMRALAEAEERRRQREAEAQRQPKEYGGRQGPDPVRYGDWENGGIVSDF